MFFVVVGVIFYGEFLSWFAVGCQDLPLGSFFGMAADHRRLSCLPLGTSVFTQFHVSSLYVRKHGPIPSESIAERIEVMKHLPINR